MTEIVKKVNICKYAWKAPDKMTHTCYLHAMNLFMHLYFDTSISKLSILRKSILFTFSQWKLDGTLLQLSERTFQDFIKVSNHLRQS